MKPIKGIEGGGLGIVKETGGIEGWNISTETGVIETDNGFICRTPWPIKPEF